MKDKNRKIFQNDRYIAQRTYVLQFFLGLNQFYDTTLKRSQIENLIP